MASTSTPAPPEHRWPPLIAVVVALVLYALLPSAFSPWVRGMTVLIGVGLLVPLIALNPVRFNRETRWSRRLSIALDVVLLVANQIQLVQLVVILATGRSSDGGTVLLAALQVWVTNIIAFALVFWELDRGGPVARSTMSREQMVPADFRFPQDEDDDAVTEVASRSSAKTGWTADFVDYLYFSLSNSMAFSPTDVMPLSHRAKLLMALEAVAGFILLALVIARSVNILAG